MPLDLGNIRQDDRPSRHVVLAWELGGHYGHLFRLLPLARALRERGLEVSLILRDLSLVGKHLPSADIRMFQAPIWQHRSHGLNEPLNYAELLARHGYLDSEVLASLTNGWRNLLGLLQPDLLVCDHSPTALLAARSLDLPRVNFCNTFELPPAMSPMPSLRPWQEVPVSRLEQSEERVLSSINNVLTKFHCAPLPTLAALFEAEASYLFSYGELDVYPQRMEGNYVGPVNSMNIGVEPRWPMGEEKRIFAYLYPGYQNFAEILKLLQQSRMRVIVHAPGLDEQTERKYHTAKMTFSRQPCDLNRLGAECDFAICHSAAGTGAKLLLAGCPVMLLPTNVEQLLSALPVEALGAGVLARPQMRPPALKKIFKHLLEDDSLRQQAQAFSEKYHDGLHHRNVEFIAAAITSRLTGAEQGLHPVAGTHDARKPSMA